MKNNLKFLIIGIFLLAAGLGFNQWILTKLFPFLGPRLSLPRGVLIAIFNVVFAGLGILFIILKNNGKKLLFSAVIFLCSLAVLLGGTEILTKFLSPIIKYYPMTSPGNVFKFGPPTGVIFTPNYRGNHKSGEFDVSLKINSEGFRSNQEFIIGSKDQKIIAVLGDSITAAREVAEEKTFVKILESNLSDAGIKQVQNYGMPGTGIDYYLQTYKYYAKQHKPDIVIIAVFLNDIADSGSFKALANYSSYGFLNKADSFLQKRSALYKFIYLQYEQSRLEVLHDFPKDGYLYENPRSNGINEIYGKFSEKLFQLTAAIKNDGAIPLIALMPSYMESSDNVWRELEKSYNLIGGKNTLDRDMLRNELRIFAGQAAAEFFDPSGSFRESYNAGERLHYIYDHHFNPAGHFLIAEMLKEKISDILRK
ncbi:MAG: SGNH/GDSL hydrolase family protein [Candidatus Nealsonbacteria bacterium]|nr:SGNH/GDSL hydrolase family protein [Candidatus Nealsonbacteria bacterium]